MSIPIYKSPCLNCGETKYGKPVYLDAEGPFCSIDCRRSYFISKELNSFSLAEEEISSGFVVETREIAKNKIKAFSNEKGLGKLLRDSAEPTSF